MLKHSITNGTDQSSLLICQFNNVQRCFLVDCQTVGWKPAEDLLVSGRNITTRWQLEHFIIIMIIVVFILLHKHRLIYHQWSPVQLLMCCVCVCVCVHVSECVCVREGESCGNGCVGGGCRVATRTGPHSLSSTLNHFRVISTLESISLAVAIHSGYKHIQMAIIYHWRLAFSVCVCVCVCVHYVVYWRTSSVLSHAVCSA